MHVIARTMLLALVMIGPAVGETQPALSGNIAIHDPSILVTDQGWVSFATGVENAPDEGTPRTKTSPDGIAWTESGPLPGGLPDWIEEELGHRPKNLWAPSAFEREGTVHLYYSASTFGSNESAIGLMTNEAFDPENPTEGWRDQGMVLRSHRGDDFNAIDPFRIDTGAGAFLAFGSFWDGIRMVELDPQSGKPAADAQLIPIASRGGGAVEAPAILEHDGRFYLFVSFDSCCRGVASTYRIMVGRAEEVTGPYIDRDGKPMLEGGGTLVQAAEDRYRGPGGQEVFTVVGEPWLAYHYYDRERGGMPKLQVAPIRFDAEGWPQLAPLPE